MDDKSESYEIKEQYSRLVFNDSLIVMYQGGMSMNMVDVGVV